MVGECIFEDEQKHQLLVLCVFLDFKHFTFNMNPTFKNDDTREGAINHVMP